MDIDDINIDVLTLISNVFMNCTVTTQDLLFFFSKVPSFLILHNFFECFTTVVNMFTSPNFKN